MTTRTSGHGRALLVAALAALALAGCSTSKNASSTAGAPAADKPQAAAPQPADAGQAGGKAVAPGAEPTTAATPVSRAIIYTGSITVRVDDVQVAAAKLNAIAKSVPNGYVSGDDRTVNQKQSIAQLTIRVPADDFDSTVSAISDLGKEIDRKVSTQDVTAQVIDTSSRIKTQQASVDRVRALLARATSINEIVSLESELTRREADLESLQSELANLTDLTSLSTITATLLGPDATTTTVPAKKDSGFVHGLKDGWHTFVSSVNVLLTIVGALLPFAIAIGVPLWLVMRFTRTRRAAAAEQRAFRLANRPPVPATAGPPMPLFPGRGPAGPPPSYPAPAPGGPVSGTPGTIATPPPPPTAAERPAKSADESGESGEES